MRGTRRRTALWLLGVAAAVLGAVLLAIDERMWDAGGPGIIGFEFAGSEERSREILVEWGDEGRDAARLSLSIDFPYVVAYGAFWALAAAAVRDLASRWDWSPFAVAGSVAIVLAPAAAAFDVVEDVALQLVLDERGGAVAPRLAAVCAAIKFAFIGFAIAYVALGLGRHALRRFPSVARPVAVGVVTLVVALVALNTWTVERETKAAKADGGRILALRQGDIHIREDGDLRRPPLLLIHGFSVSMRWWDPIVPMLAREHRVIRVDLLGHGGSEKPRTDYSMEQQAEVLAAVLRRLGVGRTAVVGHSMGGVVATALVERHRKLVSSLMMIGTEPDVRDRGGDVTGRLGFVPVIGHTGWRLIPDRVIRAELEETFIPEFDPPDRLLEDIERTTYTSFRRSGEASADYKEEKPLHERLASEEIPLTVVYGSRDYAVDRAEAERFRSVPDARIVRVNGLGHSPHIERPAQAARLTLSFAG